MILNGVEESILCGKKLIVCQGKECEMLGGEIKKGARYRTFVDPAFIENQFSSNRPWTVDVKPIYKAICVVLKRISTVPLDNGVLESTRMFGSFLNPCNSLGVFQRTIFWSMIIAVVFSSKIVKTKMFDADDF